MSSPAREAAAPGSAAGLSRLAVLALLAAVLGVAAVVFRDTLGGMVRVWNTSNFEHSYLIPLISAWLLWQQRAVLARVPVSPGWAALPVLAASLLVWLVGRLAGVNAAEHLALFALVPPLVALLFGWRMLWAAAFPVAFLFFAVPLGEFLQPTLMEWTADFTVAAVAASGVPIVREGLHFELPTGRWSVVEACSGLRYILAALPLACVYAYLSFRTVRRRLAFIALAIAVALVGNWLRAYMIVMIGHVSGMTLAVGVDHLIYGWFFFGILMAVVFWVGSRWEDPAPPARPQPTPQRPGGAAAAATLAAAGVGAAFVALTPPLSATLLDRSSARVDLAPMARGIASAAQPGAYRPGFEGAVHKVSGRMPGDAPVGVEVHQYVRQHETAEMISHSNRVLPQAPGWRALRCGGLPGASGQGAAPAWPVTECELAGPEGERQLVWSWYWVDGRLTNDAKVVKVRTAIGLLAGRGDESLAWFAWTPVDTDPAAARARLAAATARLSGLPPLAQLRTAQ